MDDKVARAWARKHFGAEVLPYQQDPATCAALCALWIRKRLKGSTIFDAKRLWRPPEAVPRTMFAATDDFGGKIEYLRIGIRDQTAFDSMEENYIKQGSSSPLFRKIKPVKEKRHVAELIDKLPHRPIEEKGKGILAVFKSTKDAKCLSSIGYDMKDAKREFAHAVALDCSKDGVVAFFDPLIGQFSFPTYENFMTWWRTCWQERGKDVGDDGNAWIDIKAEGQVWATCYKNPPVAN
jgi:hypothetical protein